jgi:DNA-binding MarR family transcriptional regulator
VKDKYEVEPTDKNSLSDEIGTPNTFVQFGTIEERAEQLAQLIGSMSSAILNLRQQRTDEKQISATDLRMLLKARHLRANYISNVQFAEPAWDMLLDLFACQLEGKQICSSSLSLAAGVPMSTALRLVDRMCNTGVFVRSPDPSDGRRFLVRLSVQSEQELLGYFRALAQMPLPFAG